MLNLPRGGLLRAANLPRGRGLDKRRRAGAAVALAAALALACGCSSQRPLQDHSQPYHRARLEEVADDLPVQGLRQAARASLDYYERRLGSVGEVALGGDRYDATELLDSARRIVAIVEGTPEREVASRLARECRAYGTAAPGRFTAYYEPVLAARRRRDGRFRYPIYRVPDPRQRRLLAARFGRLPLRAEIDGADDAVGSGRAHATGGALAGLGLELAWLDDPVARFFLHVQGSGRLLFEDGSSMRVGFAASNDAGYRSIGTLMISEGLLAQGDRSASAMRRWLTTHPHERDRILFQNPRYVFFREVSGSAPVGALGVPLVAGRSLATDPTFVPAGVLTFLRSRSPIVGADGRLRGYRPLARFAFSQDTGAAIRGPARADIFWGSGEEAGTEAGYVHEEGQLFVLVCGAERPHRALRTSVGAHSWRHPLRWRRR